MNIWKNSVRLMTTGRLAAVCGAVALLAGCTISNQEAPPLSGPSGFGMIVRLSATPEVLPRDGVSKSVINVDARDGDNPFANGRLILAADSGTLSAAEVVTDSNGHATFVFIAPGLNEAVATSTIFVTPIKNGDIGNARSDVIRIAVLGPSVPFATFLFTPTSPQGSEPVTFDASFSRLDNQPCPLCTFSWNFGDGSSGTGMVIQHVFTTFGVQNVTLTVTSPQGPANSLTRAVVVAPPAAPTADFTFTPGSPTAGSPVTFRSTSTVGLGAMIVRHVWNFDDGLPPVDQGPTTSYVHPGFAAATSHSVTLTVTDSLGRSATSAPRLINIP